MDFCKHCLNGRIVRNFFFITKERINETSLWAFESSKMKFDIKCSVRNRNSIYILVRKQY